MHNASGFIRIRWSSYCSQPNKENNKIQPIRVEQKTGRNEKVTITNGNETKELKWKKAKPLVESGKWSRL